MIQNGNPQQLFSWDYTKYMQCPFLLSTLNREKIEQSSKQDIPHPVGEYQGSSEELLQ